MNETGEWIFSDAAHEWISEAHRHPHVSYRISDEVGILPGAAFFGLKPLDNPVIAGGPPSEFNICDYDNGVEDIFL